MNDIIMKHIVIIGSGAAGLTSALELASSAKITLITKSTLRETNTTYAQGGVAAVLDQHDTIESHINDTLIAGANLCDRNAVSHTVTNGPAAIAWLINQGVEFSKNENATKKEEQWHLTQEGGHSHRRIIHAADATGLAISKTLRHKVQECSNINILQNHTAIDLIIKEENNTKQCIGVHVLNQKNSEVLTLGCDYLILASGGASKAYLYTSNPDIATGDGVAMAWRAGATVANMEFNQFHPTTLYHPKAGSFLISEALRGEGAVLKDAQGERFMLRFHPKAELAPRDIVARAIDFEMKRQGTPCMFLDISHKSDLFIETHFPNILQQCLKFDIDIRTDPIPIVPAAHYTCGGVQTNLNGETSVENLFAIGETACTGLHGANRMASNSLLECFVFAQSACKTIVQRISNHSDTHKNTSQPEKTNLPTWNNNKRTENDTVIISHSWAELRKCMWDYVGIVRNDNRLNKALKRVTLFKEDINEYYNTYKLTNDIIELRNLIQVSELIIRCAQQRKESRGLHYSLDYPDLLNQPKDSVLIPEEERILKNK